jgi:hypothetical protein
MHKQNRQGWILLDDGTFLAVPVPLLAYEEITWPPTLPEIRPGLPAPLISEGDFYRRHEIVRGEAYVFLKAPLAPSDIPEDQILKLLGRSS